MASVVAAQSTSTLAAATTPLPASSVAISSSAVSAASSIAASVSSAVVSSVIASLSSVVAPAQQPTSYSYSTVTVQGPSGPIVFSSVAAPSLPPTTIFQTSVVTVPAPFGGNASPSTLVVTITSSPATTPPPAVAATSSSSSSAASSSSTAASLQQNNNATADATSGGLSAGGRTAVAVVVPVVVVTLLVLAGILLWRRRKNKHNNAEARRKEVEDYNFNPNDDPTLPAVALSSNSSPPEMADAAGYRGWTNTNLKSAVRKTSTGFSGPLSAAAASDVASANGTTDTQPPSSDQHSTNPLIGPHSGGTTRRETMESEGIAALGAAPIASQNARSDINRGPSNASSSYSAANRSDESAEPLPQDYLAFTAYGNYGQPGPYEDVGGGGPHAAGAMAQHQQQQPVIRDVPARRNTRIEHPPVWPQQGNSGIALNF